jgi:CheY-like chemotaxis protein
MINDSGTMVAPWPILAMAGGLVPPEAGDGKGSAGLVLSGRNILVVEDESLIALLMMDALEEAGASVVGPCYTVAECLRAARTQDLDAAVLDVDLGGEDVFPAADELRQRGIPFIFHTAHADREELLARFGDVPVCRKPARIDDLVGALARVAGPQPTN